MPIDENFITTKADRKAVADGCYLDFDAANRVIKFVESYITLSTTGKPFKLLQFQKDFIIKLFGWKRPNGNRRFTRALFTSGKKLTGKTVLSAALSLYLLMADNVNSPMVVLGAVTQKQAAQIFKEVAFAVKANEFLQTKLKPKESTYQILYPKRNGELLSISSDSPGKGGWNCSACILDENSLAPNANLYEMLKGSMEAREEPLLIMLSNAGFDKGHFYYKEIYKPAKDIIIGDNDDISILPVIYEVPEEKNWKDRSLLPLANPGISYGIGRSNAFAEQYEDALRSKSAEIWYRRYVLNQWTAAENAWLDLDQWDACLGEFPDVSSAATYIGVDLSSTHDITSVCAVYPIGDKFYTKSYNFVPRAAVENREKQNLRDYTEFASQGHLKIIDGNCIDYEMIRNCIKAIPGNIQMIVFDKWNSLETSQHLQKEGFNVFNFPQYATYYNEPSKRLEQLVIERKLVHDGNSCLRWCINNTSLKSDEKGLVKPVKSSEAQKIDAAVSLLMAISQAMLHAGKDTGPTMYDTVGIQFI